MSGKCMQMTCRCSFWHKTAPACSPSGHTLEFCVCQRSHFQYGPQPTNPLICQVKFQMLHTQRAIELSLDLYPFLVGKPVVEHKGHNKRDQQRWVSMYLSDRHGLTSFLRRKATNPLPFTMNLRKIHAVLQLRLPSATSRSCRLPRHSSHHTPSP